MKVSFSILIFIWLISIRSLFYHLLVIQVCLSWMLALPKIWWIDLLYGLVECMMVLRFPLSIMFCQWNSLSIIWLLHGFVNTVDIDSYYQYWYWYRNYFLCFCHALSIYVNVFVCWFNITNSAIQCIVCSIMLIDL